jgi:hypothetical protein
MRAQRGSLTMEYEACLRAGSGVAALTIALLFWLSGAVFQHPFPWSRSQIREHGRPGAEDSFILGRN